MGDGQFVDSIKKFVPGEILAAYIALDSFIPYHAAIEFWLSSFAIFVLSCFLGVITFKRDKGNKPLNLIAVILLFIAWCALISMERVSNYADIQLIKPTAMVVIILVSTGFILFDVKEKNQKAADV